jgi:hypothetical protein
MQVVCAVAVFFLCCPVFGSCDFGTGSCDGEAETKVLFGTVAAGEIVKKTVRVKNPFGCELTLHSMSKDCGCTYPKVHGSTFAADEEIEIYLEFNVGKLVGPNTKGVAVLFTSRDSLRYVLRLEVSAIVRSALEIEVEKGFWYVDPDHLPKTYFSFRVCNYFQSGKLPLVKVDGVDDISVVPCKLSKDDETSKIVTAWTVSLRAPGQWSEFAVVPQFLVIYVTQENLEGKNLLAEKTVQVKPYPSISLRPRKVVMSKQANLVEIEMFVTLPVWSIDQVNAEINGKQIPVEVMESERSFARIRLSKQDLEKCLDSNKSVRIGLLEEGVIGSLEVIR